MNSPWPRITPFYLLSVSCVFGREVMTCFCFGFPSQCYRSREVTLSNLYFLSFSMHCHNNDIWDSFLCYVLHRANIFSWEPEGRQHSSTMFLWEPEGHYCYIKKIYDCSTLLVLNQRYFCGWKPQGAITIFGGTYTPFKPDEFQRVHPGAPVEVLRSERYLPMNSRWTPMKHRWTFEQKLPTSTPTR